MSAGSSEPTSAGTVTATGTAPPAAPPFQLPGGVPGKIRWILARWKPHRGYLVFLIFFTLVSSGVAIAYPLVFREVFDRLGRALSDPNVASDTARRMEALQQVLWLLAWIAVARFVAGLYPGARSFLNLKFDLDVRKMVFTKILEKDHTFFHRFRTGDLVTRLLDDINEYPKIAWFCCSGIFRALDSASKLFFCAAAMLFLDWRLSLLAIAPLPIVLWLIYRVRAKLTEAYEAQQKAISETNDHLEAAFSGARIVKAFRAEEGQSAALGKILARRKAAQFRVARLWATFQVLESSASRVGQLVVLSVGGWLVVEGQLTLGTLYALYVYLDMLVQPLVDLPNLLVTSRQAFVSIDREEEVMQFATTTRSTTDGAPVGPLSEISLENLSFSYDATSKDDPRVALGPLSTTFRRGDHVAIVGAVAAGKSTLLRLLTGELAPTEGRILLDGLPLDGARLDDYRARIGYAPQESLLFSESIRENVILGRVGNGDAVDPAAVDSAVLEAKLRTSLSVAQMESELQHLSRGVDTPLGQKGSRVSGGQRQRISIARALFARPEMLLLDDVTASLDAENEDRLWRGLRELLPDAIVVSVSHRIATIRRADRILVLDSGRLVDAGTHDELATRCDVYRRFLQREEERARLTGAPVGVDLGDAVGGEVGVGAGVGAGVETGLELAAKLSEGTTTG